MLVAAHWDITASTFAANYLKLTDGICRLMPFIINIKLPQALDAYSVLR